MLGARVCAHTNILYVLPVLLPFQIILPSSSSTQMSSPHYYSSSCRRWGAGLVPDRSAAASSWTTRRGDPATEAAPESGPGSPAPPPTSEEPLRGADGWGNRLLAVADDAEGVAMMGRNRVLLKRGRSTSRQPGKVCSRVGDAA